MNHTREYYQTIALGNYLEQMHDGETQTLHGFMVTRLSTGKYTLLGHVWSLLYVVEIIIHTTPEFWQN